MSDLFAEDRAPPDQIVAPEPHLLKDEGDDRARLALASDRTPLVSVRLTDDDAGTLGDALAEAITPRMAEGYGWTARQADEVDLPITVDGVDSGTVRVDEAPDDRALLQLDAGGASLGTHLTSFSAFSIAGLLWAQDDLERTRR